jgi:glycerophosphoryl diester phosphodiesterase
MNRFLCIAHRGASGHEPENTLPAFRKAIELKSDWIELDVYQVEGELVVIHDDTLDRTTNGSGPVMDKSLAYLRSLDAGKGNPIPTLPEVLELVAGRAGMNIELKGPDTAAAAAALIERYVRGGSWRYDQFIVSSFDLKAVADFRRESPAVGTGAIFGRRPPRDCSFAHDLGIRSIHLRFGSFRQALVDDAHRRGLAVLVYTVNRRTDIMRMRNMGVDGVFTDFPERVAGIGSDPP